MIIKTRGMYCFGHLLFSQYDYLRILPLCHWLEMGLDKIDYQDSFMVGGKVPDSNPSSFLWAGTTYTVVSER